MKMFNSLLGESVTYRLGRSMYMHSRGDIPNDMNRNGEVLVQNAVITAMQKLSSKSDFTIFDVGANVGDWTNSFVRQLKKQSFVEKIDIYAFEPVPSTAITLRNNIPKNSLFIHVEELALSSNSGVADIYVTGENFGINSLYEDDSGIKKELIRIHLNSASEFCNSRLIHHIHLLKCDTEGHDMEVIRGAIQLLNDERISVLQFEYNHRWAFSHNFLRDVFVTVADMPYTVAKLQKNYLLLFEEWNLELDRFFEGNYVLIHDDALSWFPTKRGNFDSSHALCIT